MIPLRAIAPNVRAPYFLVQQLLPILKSGSSIVFVSSAGGEQAQGRVTKKASFNRTAHPRLTIVCQVKSKFLQLQSHARDQHRRRCADDGGGEDVDRGRARPCFSCRLTHVGTETRHRSRRRAEEQNSNFRGSRLLRLDRSPLNTARSRYHTTKTQRRSCEAKACAVPSCPLSIIASRFRRHRVARTGVDSPPRTPDISYRAGLFF